MSRYCCCLLLWMGLLSGCEGAANDASRGLLQTAAVQVEPSVLEQYAGTYRLPSGALLRVSCKGSRLFAGTPPAELFAQSTRRFTSNGFLGELHFDRDQQGRVRRINLRLAKRDHWCQRITDSSAVDPTMMVEAGAFKMRMLIAGKGHPTIVLEDGFGSGIEQQTALQAALAKTTRVVSYDHAGTGGSEPSPHPRTARQIAHELRAALTSAGIEPPYVLVGSSIGGDYCRVFAHQFPEDAAALVLLDPTPDWEDLIRWTNTHSPARAGSYREMIERTQKAMDALMQHQESGRRAEWEALAMSRAQARESLGSLHLPVIQITGAAGRASSSIADQKVRFFESWLAANIPHAQHVLATNSAHAVSITDQQLVVDQVRGLIERLR